MVSMAPLCKEALLALRPRAAQVEIANGKPGYKAAYYREVSQYVLVFEGYHKEIGPLERFQSRI